MPKPARQLNLKLFIDPGGRHEAAWRYKESHFGLPRRESVFTHKLRESA